MAFTQAAVQHVWTGRDFHAALWALLLCLWNGSFRTDQLDRFSLSFSAWSNRIKKLLTRNGWPLFLLQFLTWFLNRNSYPAYFWFYKEKSHSVYVKSFNWTEGLISWSFKDLKIEFWQNELRRSSLKEMKSIQCYTWHWWITFDQNYQKENEPIRMVWLPSDLLCLSNLLLKLLWWLLLAIAQNETDWKKICTCCRGLKPQSESVWRWKDLAVWFFCREFDSNDVLIRFWFFRWWTSNQKNKAEFQNNCKFFLKEI